MRVVVVGGGSTYSPELVEGLGRLGDRLPVDEIVLQDIDPARLDVVAAASARIAAAHGFHGRVEGMTDLHRALDGADFVLVQIRVGGQAARQLDETLPLACGCVGQETTGAGGFAKALRTVPVVLEIAEEVRRRAASGAWIIDFTNPVGIVTRALLDNGHRAVGLCNVAIGFQRLIAAWLGVPSEEVEIAHAGLNHLTWISSVRLAGEELLPELLRAHGAELAEHVGLPVGLMESLQAIPSSYLRYYYRHDAIVEELRHRPSRAEEVSALEGRLLELYRDPGLHDKPALLAERGGAHYSDAALQLMCALRDGPGGTQVVDVRNRGAIPGLPDDAVVEVPCRVQHDGAHAITVPALTPHMVGLVAHVAAYERLTVAAATSGSRDVALQALLTHPLIGQLELAERLLNDMLVANRDMLPVFA